MPQPTALSLSFAPNAGAHHQHPDGTVIYHVDRSVAGRVQVFRPTVIDGRTIIEIGRHESCRVRIGWWRDGQGNAMEVTDEAGYPVYGIISRVMTTLVWASQEDYQWLSRSQWLILPGGVFVNPKGQRESSGAKNGVWVNGHRLSDRDNPEPLFQNGQNQTKLCLAKTLKIIVTDGVLDEHTTGWPASIWEGDGWPEVTPPSESSLLAPARQQLEGQIAAEKQQPAKPGSPWFVPSIFDPIWVWFVGRPVWYQLVLLVLSGALLALWIWER